MLEEKGRLQRHSAPHVMLQRELEERGWDAAALAARCELDVEEAARVLAGDLVITRARAREIGAALGTSGALWYDLRRSYEAWREDDPAEAGQWLSDAVRAALDEIAGPHIAKKRATVLLLAFATATDTSWTEIFEDPRVCNQRIWYQKWQHDGAIAAALELATEHALAWRDSRTAAIESRAAQERRRAIALGSLSAVKGLEVTALNRDDRADYRTEASRVLLALADDELARRLKSISGDVGVPVHGEIDVNWLQSLSDEELDGIIDRLAQTTGIAGGDVDAGRQGSASEEL